LFNVYLFIFIEEWLLHSILLCHSRTLITLEVSWDILEVLGRHEYIPLELDVIGEQVPDVVFLNDLEKFLSSQPVLQ
jgi:hypothetical protein